MSSKKHHRKSKHRKRRPSTSASSESSKRSSGSPDLLKWAFPKSSPSNWGRKDFGQKVGLKTRFKKGQIQNPRGKAVNGQQIQQGYLISNTLRRILGEAVPGDPQERTVAQAIAETIASKALVGDKEFVKILLDRSEGRVPITIDVGNTADPLMDLLTEMRKKHTELGPAERSESEEAGAKRRDKESKDKG